MNVTVVYESMFGNTRRIAERIGQGIRTPFAERPHHVVVRHVADVTFDEAVRCDLLLVGAPTHTNGLPRPATRTEAARWVADPESWLDLEPTALGDGIREWLDTLPHGGGLYSAFDTRADLPRRLSGFASRLIAQQLEATGRRQVFEPESFMVTTASHADESEFERASTWGERLAHELAGSERGSERSERLREDVGLEADLDALLDAERAADLRAGYASGYAASASVAVSASAFAVELDDMPA